MAAYSAKDIAALRQMTGAGMLDCKSALEEAGGDMEEAAKILRLKGLAGAAKRGDREAAEGAVAAVRSGDAAAVVELRCETDFVAKSEEFVALVDELAALVASKGEEAVSDLDDEIDRLRATLKENISVGRVRRLVAGSGQVVDTYLHQQAGRGVNAVAAVRSGDAAAVVELRCETDFVAKSEEFGALVDELAALVASKGEEAVSDLDDEIDRLRSTLKENISVGRVRRLVAGSGQVVDTYLHQQAGRGVNAVAVVLEGGSEELAHDIAVHIAFSKPAYLSREEVPQDEVAAERATLTEISRNEGKPEAALDKIVEGRLSGWFKERVLLDQSYVRDEKKTIAGMLGSARIVSFAQVVVGA